MVFKTENKKSPKKMKKFKVMTPSERLDLMMAFEDGTINRGDMIKLFQNLVDTGLAWRLQGFYGRTAQAMIESGLLKRKGA